jgi:hypothetical protein
LDVKLLLKRGALLAAANWQTVAVQFVVQTTFQVLLAVPVIGAGTMVAVLLGGDLRNLLQGSMREILATATGALAAEPVAFLAFTTAFGLAVVGGSVLAFLTKGGTVTILLDANEAARPIEGDPITYDALKSAARFSMNRFLDGCWRLSGPYVRLGCVLMAVYVISAGAYLAFFLYGLRAADQGLLPLPWGIIVAVSAPVLVLWITLVNLGYLLLQIAIALENVGLADAVRSVAGFVRAQGRGLGQIFLVVLVMLVAATFASTLAWSGVGLIAFVPLVGLAVFPLQMLALVIRGLVFEYLELTAFGAYLTLYTRYVVVRRGSEGRQRVGSAVAVG